MPMPKKLEADDSVCEMPGYRYPVKDWILYLRTYHKKRYVEDCESGKIEPVFTYR